MDEEKLEKRFDEIEALIKYQFKDREKLKLSLVHSSFMHENPQLAPAHNERLEFLGDTILGLIVSEFLYHQLPRREEGDLSHLRAHLVDAKACVKYAETLGIESHLLLGKGLLHGDGRGRQSIIADFFEALIAAIFLDGGYEEARLFFMRHLKSHLRQALKEPRQNWKAKLQDHSQKLYRMPPAYAIVSEEGPEHEKKFVVSVVVNDEVVGSGEGLSKKLAEQEAAKNACRKLGLYQDD